MKIKSDNQFEQEIQRQKATLDRLAIETQKFMATFKTLPPREKASALQNIQRSFQTIGAFINQPHAAQVTSGGIRFQMDNLRSSYSSLYGKWIKFEKGTLLSEA